MKRQCTFTVNRFRYSDMFRVRCRSRVQLVHGFIEWGEPMPEVKESYETEAEKQAAERMQDYYDRFEAKRGKRKRRRR